MVDFEAHGEIATDLQSNLILHLNLQIDFNLHAKLRRIFVIFPIELRIFFGTCDDGQCVYFSSQNNELCCHFK